MVRYTTFVFAVVALCACATDPAESSAAATSGAGGAITGAGGAGGSAGATAGSGGKGGGVAPFDLSKGSWTLDDVSNTAGTISHDGTIAFTKDDVAWVAFSEPDAMDSVDQDIWAASNPGTGWTGAQALTSDTAVQNAFPSLKTDGTKLYLAFNGYPEGLNDIYYMEHDAAGWGTRVNLTSAFEASGARQDFGPSLAIGKNGQLAIAYASYASDPTGTETGPTEIRVLRLQNGMAAGPPETVIPAPGTDSCEAPVAVFDTAGTLHVAADCGPLYQSDIYYANDASGTWKAEKLPGCDGHDDIAPAMAIDPDGKTVHVVWMAFVACNSACAALSYTARSGGAFAEPVLVHLGTMGEYSPTLVVDASGRPIIGYTQANAQNFNDVFVTWSDDGATFAPGINITPGTDMTNEWMPHQLVLHPKTGLPVLIYTAILPMTDPLNSEVMRATFVNGPTP